MFTKRRIVIAVIGAAVGAYAYYATGIWLVGLLLACVAASVVWGLGAYGKIADKLPHGTDD